MRIWIVSDLHSEFEPFTPPDPFPDADVLVIAGDFSVGGIVHALEWAERHVSLKMPTLIVAGNHDFYRAAFLDAVREARDAARRMERVHFLENDAVTIGGVTFFGCTLWTDFRLNGSPELSMFEAGKAMSDYKYVRYSKQPFRRFSPLDTLRIHQQSAAYLDRALAEVTGPAVVITHHAPSPLSVPRRYKGHRLSPAYASDLETLILRRGPDLWMHGHIHDRVDYMLGKTRVLSNPRGYPGEIDDFDQLMIITI